LAAARHIRGRDYAFRAPGDVVAARHTPARRYRSRVAGLAWETPVGGHRAAAYHRRMPDLSTRAADITDPAVMLERIAYRNRRIITRVGQNGKEPVSFAKNLASRTRSDIRRLAELLDVELDESAWS
jgi:hypothetical protein